MTKLNHYVQFKTIFDHFRSFRMGTLSKMMGNFKIVAKALLSPVLHWFIDVTTKLKVEPNTLQDCKDIDGLNFYKISFNLQ